VKEKKEEGLRERKRGRGDEEREGVIERKRGRCEGEK